MDFRKGGVEVKKTLIAYGKLFFFVLNASATLTR